MQRILFITRSPRWTFCHPKLLQILSPFGLSVPPPLLLLTPSPHPASCYPSPHPASCYPSPRTDKSAEKINVQRSPDSPHPPHLEALFLNAAVAHVIICLLEHFSPLPFSWGGWNFCFYEDFLIRYPFVTVTVMLQLIVNGILNVTNNYNLLLKVVWGFSSSRYLKHHIMCSLNFEVNFTSRYSKYPFVCISEYFPVWELLYMFSSRYLDISLAKKKLQYLQ